MVTANQQLIPQKEEDITKAEWIPLSEVQNLKGNVFKNINEVTEAYIIKRTLKV